MLRDQFGAPALPPGVCASISHKDQIAVALVCKGQTRRSFTQREYIHNTGRGIGGARLTCAMCPCFLVHLYCLAPQARVSVMV